MPSSFLLLCGQAVGVDLATAKLGLGGGGGHDKLRHVESGLMTHERSRASLAGCYDPCFYLTDLLLVPL